MFRAGVPPARVAARLAPPRFTGDFVLLADVSEFQPDIADAAYLAWSQAIVIRAAYGAQHDDKAWYGGARRDALHAGGVKFLGIYQYVTAFEDPAAQARELVRLAGAMRPGEKIIADLEEGSGDQRSRLQAWATVIFDELGTYPWAYSGLNFAAAHGLGAVDWVAAYGQPEPPAPHLLWQFTDAFTVPGAGTADCSVFHGTIDALAGAAYGGQQQNWTETLVNSLPTLRQGDADHPGAVQFVHRLQALAKVIGDINGLAAASAVKADGNFGPATLLGLLRVQTFFGLTEDGICGPRTWGALVAGQHA